MARVRYLVLLLLAVWALPASAQTVILGDGTPATKVVVYGSNGTESTAASGAATEATLASVDASLQTLLTRLGSDVTEDDAESSGITGPAVMNVRRDAAASSAGTSGDYATFNTDALGLLWTRNLDPCTGVSKTFIPISISSATTTELTPSLAGASTNYYVCSINLVASAADNVAIVDDDSDGCGSVTAGMNTTGTTAASGWNLPANGGIALGNGQSSVMKTNGTNRVICAVTSSTAQLSGTIVVVAAP